MSDEAYDQVLEGLQREEPKPTVRRPPAARQTVRKAPRARPEGTSLQYGRRADKAYTQVNAAIRKELKPSLFFYLKEEGKTLSEVIEDFLEAYVAERGGIIGGKRRRKK